ncbi:hypothetical protein ABPG75_004759 [Micractinium tetrahymenae]
MNLLPYGDLQPAPEESAEAAFAAAQACMALFCEARQSQRDLDSVVAFLPEAVIDRLLERKRAKREEEAARGGGGGGMAEQLELGQQRGREREQQPLQQQRREQRQQEGEGLTELSFEELVALAQPTDLALDAYSARGVLAAPPLRATVLSSLKLAADRFLQRYEVLSQTGEEMVLTIDMQLEESLQPKYRGLQVVKRWFLKGITGEPAYPGEVPRKPEPCWGPDAVVQAQLEALRIGDVAGVFAFASPQNQQATGPVERFGALLRGDTYRPLLHHEAADVLRTIQMQPDLAMLIVGVRSNIPTSEPGVAQRVVYSWAVRLQRQEAGPEFHNCWMTESVRPISQSLFK